MTVLRSLLFWLIYFSFSQLAWGQSTLDSTFHVKFEALQFHERENGELNSGLLGVELQTELSSELSESISWSLSPLLVEEPDNYSTLEKHYFDWGDSHLQISGESWSLKAGTNILTWGVTDGYNPLDTVNSRQYFNPLRPRKRSELSLVISQSFEKFEYDLIYIPQKRGSLLPGSKSRWLPQDVYIPYSLENNVVLQLPEHLRYQYHYEEDLNEARNHNFGLRMQLHTAGFDFGIMGYEGAANFPLIQPGVTGTIIEISPKTVVDVDPDVLLHQRFYKIRQVGFWLIRPQGATLLKYATSYSQSLGAYSDLPGWTHESVAAVERPFQVSSNASLILLLQYSFIASEVRNDSNLSITEIFRNTWMGGFRLTWQEIWVVSTMALYHQTSNSNFFEISLMRRLWDTWTAQLTLNLIQGPEDSVLGVYKKNDSATLSLSRSF